jgi:hypothetical protein
VAFQEALFPGAAEEKKKTEVAVLDRTSGDRWHQDRREGEGPYDQNGKTKVSGTFSRLKRFLTPLFSGAEMIASEVRINAIDGMSPRLAEIAAKNNLAVRLRDLDDELLTELGRLQGELRRKLVRLLEDLEDSLSPP